MTCSNAALVPSNTSDALFRLWGKALSDAILAAGWTKAADTGQIVWASALAPTVAATASGYEIWYMSDALTRWYLKIEYGSGSVATYPAVWLTLGTATNGAGTLSGQVSTRFTAAAATTSAVTAYTCAFAGDTAWLACAMFYDSSATQTFGFMIERLKDAAGADADTGVVIHGYCSGHRFHQVVPLTGTIATINDSTTNYPSFPMMTPPYGLTTAVSGVTVGICTLHPWAQIHFPSIVGAVVYYTSVPDISNYAMFAVTHYGASHTYLSLGAFAVCGTNLALAMRYE